MILQEIADIHSHILPGVDDGASSVEESLEMFRLLATQGCTDVIATPHHHPQRGHADVHEILEAKRKTELAINTSEIKITLHTGMEIYYEEDTVERLKAGNLLSLADSPYVLVEFYHSVLLQVMEHAVYSLLEAGYWPVIAHAERYHCVLRHPEYVERLVNIGAYIQVNADLFAVWPSAEMRKLRKYLLKNRYLHFVATDAHNAGTRAPRLEQTMKYLEHKVPGLAQEILHVNPQYILRGEILRRF